MNSAHRCLVTGLTGALPVGSDKSSTLYGSTGRVLLAPVAPE